MESLWWGNMGLHLLRNMRLFFPLSTFHKTPFSYPENGELISPYLTFQLRFLWVSGRGQSQNRTGDGGYCSWSCFWNRACAVPASPVPFPDRRESVASCSGVCKLLSSVYLTPTQNLRECSPDRHFSPRRPGAEQAEAGNQDAS